MCKYRVVLRHDGTYVPQKKVGLFKWVDLQIPFPYNACDQEQVIRFVKYEKACEIKRKHQRDRVVWKL